MFAKGHKAETDIAQRNAIERSRHQTPDLYREGNCQEYAKRVNLANNVDIRSQRRGAYTKMYQQPEIT